MTGDEQDAYAWLDGSWLEVAACFTLLQGVAEQQVLDAVAPDPVRGVHRGFGGPLTGDRWIDPYGDLLDPGSGELADLAAQDRDVLWILDLGHAGHPGWLLVVEDNGFTGSRPEVARQLGAHRHAAAFWNAGVSARLLLAEQGQVLADEEIGTGPSTPLVERLSEGLQLDPFVPGYLPWTQAGLVVLERATRIRITPEILRGPSTLVTISDGPTAGFVLTLEQIVPVPPTVTQRASGRPSADTSDPAGPPPARPPRPGSAGAVVPAPSSPDWQAAAAGWLPGRLAVGGGLGRSGDVALQLAGLAAYPTGVELELEIARRPGSADDFSVFDALQQPVDVSGQIRPGFLRLEVTFSDGRRASTAAPWHDPVRPPPRPVLGGSGTSEHHRYRATLWLWPLPPPGPVRVTCSWQSQGIVRQVLGLDGDEIVQAAARAERLW